MAIDDAFRVLIIGGGSAGLLTAQGLKKHGINSVVFEQDAALDSRPRDWNFGIYWAQSPLSDCVSEEMTKEIIEKGQVDSRPLSPDEFMPIYNGKTGEVMKKLPAPNNIRLNRRNFLRIITRGVDIRYGKKLRDIESDGQTVTAYFEDGTSESGNLIVGAEGAHSKIREFLVGKDKAKPTPSPVVASVSMPKIPRESAIAFQKLHPRYAFILHPAGINAWIGVHNAFTGTEPGDWTFMMMQSWLPNPEYNPNELNSSPKILSDMKDRMQVFAEPFRSIFESIPEDSAAWHNGLSYWIPEPWDNRNGTVTLVGDAAHPMTFHRGQGLNNAIHDAAMLTKMLGETLKSNPQAAVSAYEEEMFQRAKEAVISSNMNTNAVHDFDMLLKSPLFTSGLGKTKLASDEK